MLLSPCSRGYNRKVIVIGVDPQHLLKDARQKAGLTQSALALRAHVRQPLISRIETGKEQPSLPTLRRLVAACGFQVTLELVRTTPLTPEVSPQTPEDIRAAIASALERR